MGSPAFGYKSASPRMVVPEISGDRVLAGIQFDNPLQQSHRPPTPGAEEILLVQNLDNPSAEPAGSMATPEISQLTTEESGTGEAIITIESTQAIQYTAFKLLNPLRLVLDFPKMGRGFLKDPIEVNKGVVDKIRPLYFDEAKVLRLEIGLNRAAGYDIQKPIKNRLVIRVREAAAEIPPALPTSPKSAAEQKMKPKTKPPTQKKVAQSKEKLAKIEKDPCEPLLGGKKEKISLDFQDANVRNLFRIFSEISGFNLIISPEVNGMVNMRLLDVPWNEAFEIILANSSLGRKCLGKNIIRVASLRTLANEEDHKVEDNKRKRQKKITEKLAAELVTEVSRLNYADIKEVAKNLETLKTERGKITLDSRTNTLILTDIRENVTDMLNLIRVLDVQTPQVMIEARIVEVNKKVTQQLGVQWGLTGDLDTGGGGRSVSKLASPSGANSPFLVDLLPGGSALSSGATSGFLLGLGGLAKGVNLDIQLTALEKQGDARILSSPKVTTLDNKEARIKSGRSIPFSTVSQNGTVIQFIDFELSLTVTPHITSDDYIYMVIDATKNSANPSVIVAGFPEITTKEAHTEVLVANGDTTVLGGIYESTIKRNKEGVPFLSKIPGLGVLFRNFDDADDVDELLIFITPTVISNEASRKL
ncbi:MAG: type IV pilus secretin PilQ [Nitrospinaceae bacterium]